MQRSSLAKRAIYDRYRDDRDHLAMKAIIV